MKIVILDGFAANPGDISWEGLKALGECTIYDRTAPEEVLERSAGAEVILTNKVIINADHMAALPELKYIGVLATGYNVVDTAAAKERGIIVTNIPAYSTASVAQMVFAHILNISQQVQRHSEEVHKGRWTNSKDFCFWDTPLMELRDKKIGLVGLGNTGYTTARVAIGFGMQVYALTSKSHFQLPPEIKKMDLDQLFSECCQPSLSAYPGNSRTGERPPSRYDEAERYSYQYRPWSAHQRTRLGRRTEQREDLCCRSRRAFYRTSSCRQSVTDCKELLHHPAYRMGYNRSSRTSDEYGDQ